MSHGDHAVFVIDDDKRVRDGLSELLESRGIGVTTFASAREYLKAPKPENPSCLVLDVRLPDIDGFELQARLANEPHPPIVFITGHGDIPMTVRAMKLGAVDFLAKPFRDHELLAAIQTALERDREARRDRSVLNELQGRLNRLSARERDVLPLVVSGLMNKQGAAELGISEITFQIHRGNLMRKMHADSLADLVRIATKLGIPITHSRHGN
ncbi:DNA-binding response regulator [Sinorhizobium meliloti]|uniref:Response regulator n=1 Tax=Rhizobium meliloti TaxID=382 RepID=A0AAW9TSR5_RHIML|nr:response regulator [Sinorhizobium meliloti]AEG06989.1 two component transcriptional regulator, LuxR family [Sinorhizobium meliloti BL225C]AIM02296.1 LuxR family transcriptional regulator [Sinorhizobium meliloti]ARS66945.1 DNA-binding response regulator [Sinorhizobium meliloti RU11/001]ASQ02026.1 DNA-binding response regulator [Sinorhizobium meliloti]MBP2470116.1 FixJ family two-component response regulator [Sinorhizobium meliloti]